MRRELEIIAGDLHATAVRTTGDQLLGLRLRVDVQLGQLAGQPPVGPPHRIWAAGPISGIPP